MEWIDIAGIVFISVTMNHLGLIGKIEEIYGKEIPIINCPKCASFWITFIFSLWEVSSFYGVIKVLAISFLASYIAIWLELLEGYVDTLYIRLYGKIYETSDNTPAADADDGNSAGTVS